MTGKLDMFADQPTVSPAYVANGNNAWAQRYWQELSEVVLRYADRLPRNTQRHLGPSEIGHACDRQVVGKMAGISLGSSAGAIRGTYAWASIVGTAIHAFLDDAFTWAAQQPEWPGRFLSETRVCPDPGVPQPHPGTADLFDTLYFSLDDHKCQSEAVRARLRKHGPPLHYFLQLLFYAIGYMHQGYDVKRIVLVSWPRTKSTLDDGYCWAHEITTEDLELAVSYLEKTRAREELAALMAQGQVSFWEVPPTPSPEDCEFCPFANPAALVDGTSKGCPGMSLKKLHQVTHLSGLQSFRDQVMWWMSRWEAAIR